MKDVEGVVLQAHNKRKLWLGVSVLGVGATVEIHADLVEAEVESHRGRRPTRRSIADEVESIEFRGRRVYVAGHRGMVGSALLRALAPLESRAHHADVGGTGSAESGGDGRVLPAERPEIVLFAAAKVGGIQANSSAPAEFLVRQSGDGGERDSCRLRVRHGAICFLGQHVRLSAARTAADARIGADTATLEPTNEGYALAKIAGLKLCQMYRRQYGVLFHSLMPTNLYGPGDKYHPDHAHVLPSLIRRFHEAKEEGTAVGDNLGHRPATARVPARRRPGGGRAACGGARRSARLGQRRLGRGGFDPGAGADGGGNGRIRGRDRHRSVAAGRHAAEAGRLRR